MGIKRRFENVVGVEEEEVRHASPIGDPIRVSRRGRKKRNHYSSFEFKGNVYELEDTVLLTSLAVNGKPYVAVIKDIADSESGLTVTGQWFYRQEEAKNKGGRTWQVQVTRELFYSFHLDVVPAESILHKCIVHFVPLNKQLPLCTEHPGFVVRKVYDTVERKLRNFTDPDLEDYKKDELNQLVKKTIERTGELLDIEPEDVSADCDDLRGENTPLADRGCTGVEQLTEAEKPSSFKNDDLKYHAIIAKFNALTGDSYRDEWIKKFLQGIQRACEEVTLLEANREKSSVAVPCQLQHTDGNSCIRERANDEEKKLWPDSAIAVVAALEKASYERFGSDFQEYHDKMQLLDFNIKNNVLLARGLLTKEFVPEVIIAMSPDELKDGLTVDAKMPNALEESEDIQMTDTKCSRCKAKKAAITDAIHGGVHGNQYQLGCQACGHYWYASGEAVSPSVMEKYQIRLGSSLFSE